MSREAFAFASYSAVCESSKIEDETANRFGRKQFHIENQWYYGKLMLADRGRTVSFRQMQRVVDRVLQLDPKIRFSAFFNEQGKIIVGGMREGVPTLEPDQSVTAKVFFQVVIAVSIAKEWERYYGNCHSVVLNYPKVRIILFPIDKMTAYGASMEPEVDNGIYADIFGILSEELSK